MTFYRFNNLEITPAKQGAGQYSKVSFPIRYGQFSEIKTKDYIFQFNLNGEIKSILGLNKTDWHHSNEWFKRTVSNDWVYYSAAGYNGVYSLLGEYYLPCFTYESNSIFSVYSFDNDVYKNALHALEDLYKDIKRVQLNVLPTPVKTVLDSIVQNDSGTLKRKGKDFHSIIGGPITVLPPDARHADYDIIPIMVADGCLYHCKFCSVKTGSKFSTRDRKDIIAQISALKSFYGSDIKNYNSIFLGQNDALNSGELIEYAAKNAYEQFGFAQSYMQGANLFLFGSVDSLLKADDTLLQMIDKLPFYTYINIGFESADQGTLDMLGKPLKSKDIEKAFDKMLDINHRFNTIEITANFLMGQHFSPEHIESILSLANKKIDHYYSKGCIYISPMIGTGENRELQKQFTAFKNKNKLPTFLYIIQRL